jgi:phosphoribosylamine---glycine ligase
MKILIIDQSGCGCGLSFALRSQHYGHEVKMFIRHNKDGSRSEAGDGGLVKRVSNWEDHMNWADLIFCTDNLYYIHALERYRDKGYPIFGPSIDTNRWEQERDHGEMVLNKAGIKTIPSQTFDNYDDAIAYVIENPRRFVSKPIGDGDKTLSYVAKSAADMIYMLKRWKKKNSFKGKFILQEFRPGIEFGVGGWFGPAGFSKHFCESWEHKKLMDGELGVTTGEQGTIVRYTQESKLADQMLKPLTDMLHGLGYTGYIDVNCIIDKQGQAWPLEFTMRPGWPLFNIQLSLHKGDPAQWMLDLIDGKDTLKVSDKIAAGVVVTIPDYPFSHITKKENSGYPIWGMDMDDAVHDVHLCEVQWGKGPAMVDGELKMEEPMFVTAGDYVCTVVGLGDTVESARKAVYSKIKKKIEIPNSIAYRTDIGEKVQKCLPELHDHGYAIGAEAGEDE